MSEVVCLNWNFHKDIVGGILQVSRSIEVQGGRGLIVLLEYLSRSPSSTDKHTYFKPH